VNRAHLSALSLLLFQAVTPGCGPSDAEKKAEAEKKALDAAFTSIVEPVGLISAYRPHLAPPDDTVKYAPKRHADLDRAMGAAANEIRHAANAARQNVERAGAGGTKNLEAALKGVTAVCMDTQEPEVVAKCENAVKALDVALDQAEATRTAAGASVKVPRIAPTSITADAKKAVDSFLRARGSGPSEAEFVKKRADPAAAVSDVIAACESAASEAEATQKQFERAEEPIRLVAVTHKMALDSQCSKLKAADTLRKEVGECKKKAKSSECKISCGKAKVMIDDGLPAATFEPLAKEYAEICKE
jgi:hypothetical protein